MTSSVSATVSRRLLGRTGIEVSAVGMGCWPIGGPDHNLGMPMGWAPIDDATALAGLERAVQLGANLFDTADVYGHGHSERLLGRLVAQVPRDTVVLTSKVGYFRGTAAHGYEPRHMANQLAQSLENLGVDRIDVYYLHHLDFGPEDRYLDGAIEVMRGFKSDGLIEAIGMRGPHRFALDRLTTEPALRGDKVARFQALFDRVQPDVIAVRDNLLTPDDRSAGIFALADAHDCGILINKPLAQGLLTGSYRPDNPRTFTDGDHRGRKRWFRQDALRVIAAGIDRLHDMFGSASADLIRIALWACLTRSSHAAVLTGFTHPDQVQMNLTCLGERPDDAQLRAARNVMAGVQAQLDAAGEVFVDELTTAGGAR